MVLLALLLTVSAVFAQAPQSAHVETDKINYLLHTIESLQGAQFIRNGSTYSAADAVAHLRLKWHTAGSHVVTAEDFIRNCASKSSMSGLPYAIRFADGHEVTSADFLHQQLSEYERTH